jgi:Tfp pilus assembly protein PilF
MDAARTRSQLNQIPQALRAVMAFLLTDPGHLDGLTLAGQCHLEQGRPDSARRYFEKALAQDPDHRPAAQGLARCRPAAASVSPAKAAGP